MLKFSPWIRFFKFFLVVRFLDTIECENSLCVFLLLYANSGNTANLQLLAPAVHPKSSQNTRKESMHTKRRRQEIKKTVHISVNNNTNFKFFQILSFFTIWDGLSLKTISRYCPFKYIYLQADSTVHGKAGQHRLQPLLFVLQQGQEWKGLKVYKLL